MSDGVVIRAGRGLYTVQTDTGRIMPCRLRGNLKKDFTYGESAGTKHKVESTRRKAESDAVAVGDRVDVDESEGNKGLIVEIYPRRAALSRQATGRERVRQTLVANLELAIIVFSASEPRPDLYKLDRFLVMASDNELNGLIVFNKSELVSPAELTEISEEYIAIGYDVLATSAKSGKGIAELREAMRGKISAFCGPSGVGKSSLVNALQPGMTLKTQEIGMVTGKGRHTTVSAELIPLDFGGWVADTPGLRQVEFWDLPPEDVGFAFPEIADLMGHCRFANCVHKTEPGCAVRAAVKSGKMSARRYQSYLEMIVTTD